MSNYSQITSFGPKDALVSGNPAKLVKGAELDPEFASIAAAIQSKLDATSLATEVGSQAIIVATNSPTASTIGFRGIPQIITSSNYTVTMADVGKHILHPSGAGAADTITIPSNAAVPIPVGSVLVFMNFDTNPVSISINSDNIYMAGTGVVGTRTLGAYGIATAMKFTSTQWLISGVNLS